ncbi:MAG: DHH family phosphoesterase, partial [Candidatus Eiseniibacteriota bacterium]
MSIPTGLEAVLQAIDRARRCLISSHVDPEGDSLGSQLVLADILRELGKEAWMVDADRPPERFAFMPGIEEIVTPADLGDTGFDTAFVVDCGSLDRIGSVAALVDGLDIVNIDHHGSNARFGQVNHVVVDACATGFLMYELNEALGLTLDRRKAINIYTAIITDTGNFQYSNTSSEVLRVASRLVDTG